ncbi:hypothetical protein ISX56_30500, partial [Serratia ureilytica]|nr:hypothetical protein [Serratia ureilytica]
TTPLFPACSAPYTTLIRGVPDLVLMLLIFYGLQIALNNITTLLGFSQIDIDPPRAEHAPPPMTGQTVATQGAITVDQVKINYQAQTGVLELSKEDPEDPVTGMFYVAYFKKNENKNESRPITFIYNGGPGSASLLAAIWGRWGLNGLSLLSQRKHSWRLHQLTDNQYSLLNVKRSGVYRMPPERV